MCFQAPPPPALPKNITLLIRSSSFIHHHKFVHIYGRAVGTASLPHPVSAPLFFSIYIYFFRRISRKEQKGKERKKNTPTERNITKRKRGFFLGAERV